MVYCKVFLNDKAVRTLLFSDTHFSHIVDLKLLQYLKKRILSADRVIIVGDFWDVWHTSFDAFLASGWSEIFPLLKQRRTVYLWGNHDPKKYMDKRVKRFCSHIAREYIVKANGHRWIVTHGDIFTTTNEQLFRVTHEHEWAKSILRVWERIEYFVARKIGDRGLKMFDRKYDIAVRNAVKKDGRRYITGHTHVFRTDPTKKFLNTGFCRHGLAQTIEIVNGKFIFRSERYDK